MRERMAWGLFAVLCAVGVAGFVWEGLSPAAVWAPEGWRRFLVFAALFAAWAGVWRGRLWPATAALAGAYGVWWAGPLAVAGPVYLLGSCWLVGTVLAPRARAWMATALGMCLWILVISVAVRFPVQTPAVYWVVIGLPYLWGWRRVRALRFPVCGWGDGALVFVLLALFAVALKPETGADALAVHLLAPELIAYEKMWAFDIGRFAWAVMPMGADWLFTAGYLLGGETGARLLNFGVLAVLTVGIRDVAGRWSGWAAALFASTPLVQLVTGSLFVENVWALVVLGGAVAVVEGELIWAGALLGTGMAVKFGTAAFLAPLAVMAVLQRRPRAALAGLGLVVALAAPTYLTAWVKTGNPVYPYMNHVFKSPSFESGEAFQELRFREPLGWRTGYDLTFRSERFFEGAGGGGGFQYFLLLAPAAVMMRRRGLLLAGLAGGVILYLSQPNLRYLYPAMGLLAAGLAEFPAVWVLGAVGVLNLSFLPAAGYYHREFALPTRAAAEAYLEVGHPQRKLIAYLNEHAPGEAAAFFGGNPVAGFHGRAYTDQWHSHPFSVRLNGWSSGEEARRELGSLGVRWVVAPAGGVTRYPAVNVLLRGVAPVAVSGRFAVFPVPERVEDGFLGGDSPGPGMRFSGVWSHLADFPEAVGGTLSYSNVAGSRMRMMFVGDGVVWVFTRAVNRGVGVVRIDGVERGRVDLYAAETRWRESWRVVGLGTGQHTIEIEVTGERSPAAIDVYVDVDALAVIQR